MTRLIQVRLWGARNRWRKASSGHRMAYAFFAVLTALFWVGLSFGMVKLIGAFTVEVFGPMLTRKLLEILVMALFFMLIFSNVITALSTFYLSADLELLHGLPISRSTFHYARLAEAVIQSSWMMAMFGLPVFLAYGQVYEAPIWWYPLLVACVIAFILIPGAVGVIVASVLVNVFPARRAREIMALFGLLGLIGLFLFLRLLRPEQLVNAEGFESLAAYVATVQAPMGEPLPSGWQGSSWGPSRESRSTPWAWDCF